MAFNRRNLPILCNFAGSVLLGLVAVKCIQWLLPKEVNGYYSLFIGLTLLGQKVTHAGLTNHAARFWQRESQKSHATYLLFLWKQFWKYSLLLGLLLGIYVLNEGLFKGNTMWMPLFPTLFLGACGMAFIELAVLLCNAAEKHWMIFILRTGGLLLRMVFPLGLAYLIAPNIHVLGAGFALHGIVIGIGVVLYFYPHLGSNSDSQRQSELARELKAYGNPFILLGVGSWILEVSDRYVIEIFFGEGMVGNFDIANRLSTYAVAMVFLSMMQGFFPRIFKLADQARSESDWRVISRRCDLFSLAFAGLGLACVAALHALGPYLRGWLINENYALSITMILPAGLAALATQINQFHFLLLQGQQKSDVMVKIMLTLASVKLGVGVLASFVSWDCYRLWLCSSFLVIAWIGRTMIHHEAFKHFKKQDG